MRLTKYNILVVIAVIIICLLKWLSDVANVCLWLLASVSTVASCSNAILTYKSTKSYMPYIHTYYKHTHTHTLIQIHTYQPFFCQHSIFAIVVVISVEIRVAAKAQRRRSLSCCASCFGKKINYKEIAEIKRESLNNTPPLAFASAHLCACVCCIFNIFTTTNSQSLKKLIINLKILFVYV